MKIAEVMAWNKDLGNTKPYTIAFKTVDEVRNVFVKITLDDGVLGIGAGNPSEYVVGESIEQSIQVLEQESFDYLIGRNIYELNLLAAETQTRFPANPAVRAAIDIALYDAFSRSLNLPLVKYLGQKIESLPTSCTIGIKNVEETLAEAYEYTARGFDVVKVKLGRDVDEDIERILKLREQFPQAVIRIDANQGYTPEETLKFYRATQEAGVELIEQPLPAKAVDEMRALPMVLRKIIAADESLITPADAMNLTASPMACGIYNIKLMKCGGITPALAIAGIARYSNIDLFWGCNDESIVSITAALHAAFSCEHTKYIDLDGSLDLASDVVTGGFILRKGRMYCSEKPGLGLELI